MSLGYEFAPIDVSIMTHPKAFAAGIEAMGLWLWGMAYAKQHRTGGRLHRAAVLGAWGGKRNIMLAKRLVESGLWAAREDGDWDVYNFEKKSARSSVERVRRFREKQRRSAPSGVTESVTPSVTETPPVTRVTETLKRSASVSVSSSVSSDLSADRESATGSPGVPDWFAVEAVEMVRMDAGFEVDQIGARWLEYSAGRRRKTWPMDAGDAAGWLTNVIRRERREAAEKPKARGAEATKQPYDENAPWLKLPEVG